MEDLERQETIERVRQKYPDIPFPNVYLDHVWRGIDGKQHIEGKSAIVVNYKGEENVSAICSDQYKLVEHEVAVDHFEKVVNSFEEYGKPLINISLLSHGAKLNCTATFPECTTKVGKDKLAPRAGVRNSVDMAWEYESWFGGMVERCTNGLLMFKKLINGKQKHRLTLDLNEHMENMALGMSRMSEQYQIWNSWTKLQLNRVQTDTILEALPVSEKQVEKILELPETGSGMVLKERLNKGHSVSGWDLNSVVTQFMTHEVKDSASKVDKEGAVSDALHKQLARVM